MSAVFRHADCEAVEVSPSWDLRVQLADVINWLERPDNAEAVRGWILDIGFNSRLGNVVAVQGEVIPIATMRRLVENGNELWLSLFPPFASD